MSANTATKQFYTVAEWEPKTHTIGVVKTSNSKTGKNASLLYPNTNRFYLSTGRLSSPFGVTCSTDFVNKEGDANSASQSTSNVGPVKYTVSLSLGECEFKRKLEDLDEHIVELSCTEKLDKVTGLPELFAVKTVGGRKTDPAQIASIAENKYSPSVKYPKDQTSSYPPRFIRTNPKNPSEIETEFYDKAGKRISGVSLDPTSDMYIKHIIPPNSQCNFLVDGYIWSLDSTGFGIKWYIKQIRVYPAQEVIPQGVCMIGNDETDEPTADVTTSVTTRVQQNTHSHSTTTLQDPKLDDDEEDLLDEDQPLN